MSSRALFLIFIFFGLSCSNDKTSKANLHFVVDRFDNGVEEGLQEMFVFIEQKCSQFNSNKISKTLRRYDLNAESPLSIKQKSNFGFSKDITIDEKKKLLSYELSQISFLEQNIHPDKVNRLEAYLDQFEKENTRILSLNSFGLTYFDFHDSYQISHFRSVEDISDIIADLLCTDAGTKDILILNRIFVDEEIKNCILTCRKLPKRMVCGDNNEKYYNLNCLECYPDVNMVPCIDTVDIFRHIENEAIALEIENSYEEEDLALQAQTAPSSISEQQAILPVKKEATQERNSLPVVTEKKKKPIVTSEPEEEVRKTAAPIEKKKPAPKKKAEAQKPSPPSPKIVIDDYALRGSNAVEIRGRIDNHDVNKGSLFGQVDANSRRQITLHSNGNFTIVESIQSQREIDLKLEYKYAKIKFIKANKSLILTN